MKTVKAYCLSYYELGICSEDHWEKPFLVVKDEETAKIETNRLNLWIKETSETIPKLTVTYEEQEEYEKQTAAIVKFTEEIAYPYEIFSGCFRNWEYGSFDGAVRYTEILIQDDVANEDGPEQYVMSTIRIGVRTSAVIRSILKRRGDILKKRPKESVIILMVILLMVNLQK